MLLNKYLRVSVGIYIAFLLKDDIAAQAMEKDNDNIFQLPNPSEELLSSYTETYEILLEQADQGNVQAQFMLGVFYQTGHGVLQDPQQAFQWYYRAAQQDYIPAQCNLGIMHASGHGVLQDKEVALKWYSRAAFNLIVGNKHPNKTHKEIFSHYYQLAKEGHPEAYLELSFMYKEGWGVENNDSAALECLRKIAEQGKADAQHNLGLMYAHGQGIERNEYTAVEWLKKAAEQGHANAQYDLGLMYAHGQGIGKDEYIAVEWLRKAAEQGHANAQYNLSLIYAHNQVIKKDEYIAVEWLKKAAEQGKADAQYELGLMYAHGQGIERNEYIAIEWLKKAAEQGHTDAQYNLAVSNMFRYNDFAEALKWFFKRMETKNNEASYEEAYIHTMMLLSRNWHASFLDGEKIPNSLDNILQNLIQILSQIKYYNTYVSSEQEIFEMSNPDSLPSSSLIYEMYTPLSTFLERLCPLLLQLGVDSPNDLITRQKNNWNKEIKAKLAPFLQEYSKKRDNVTGLLIDCIKMNDLNPLFEGIVYLNSWLRGYNITVSENKSPFISVFTFPSGQAYLNVGEEAHRVAELLKAIFKQHEEIRNYLHNLIDVFSTSLETHPLVEQLKLQEEFYQTLKKKKELIKHIVQDKVSPTKKEELGLLEDHLNDIRKRFIMSLNRSTNIQSSKVSEGRNSSITPKKFSEYFTQKLVGWGRYIIAPSCITSSYTLNPLVEFPRLFDLKLWETYAYLLDLPQIIEEAINETVGLRNSLFKKKYPWIFKNQE